MLVALPVPFGALVSLQELHGVAGLQELNLTGCSGLVSLPVSLGALSRLPTLCLQGCGELVVLPESSQALTGPGVQRAGCPARVPGGADRAAGAQVENLLGPYRAACLTGGAVWLAGAPLLLQQAHRAAGRAEHSDLVAPFDL